MNEVKEWFEYIYYHDQESWNVAIGITFLALAYELGRRLWQKKVNWWDNSPRRRGKFMRRARRDYIRSDTIDALVDHIEKRVAQGDYTRKEAKELYREARKAWEVKDLFPNPNLLKEDIKARIAKHVNDPVPLPDKTPKKPMFSGKPTRLAKA